MSVAKYEEIKRALLERITSGSWSPGTAIPSEVDLAEEFGVSRPTIGRAMRDLVAAGLIERRRRAGSRVTVRSAPAATLRVPIVRREIEDRGGLYTYLLLDRREDVPPPAVSATFASGARNGGEAPPALNLRALHFENHRVHQLEDRWINLRALPAAAQRDFALESANEWLVRNVPYTQLEQVLSAEAAAGSEATELQVEKGDPLFVIERTTWSGDAALTCVRLLHPAAGFRIVARHSV